MNFAGWAYLIVDWLSLTQSLRVSITLIRLFQSVVDRSIKICLNSSIVIGSMGFETR